MPVGGSQVGSGRHTASHRFAPVLTTGPCPWASQRCLKAIGNHVYQSYVLLSRFSRSKEILLPRPRFSGPSHAATLAISRSILVLLLGSGALDLVPAPRPAQANAQPQAARRPNIVFILTDDLSMNLLPFMPQVAEIRKQGTTFTNYFVTDSLCCPSRSSIFTGKLPHNTGVFKNTGRDGGYEAFNAYGNPSQTFAVALRKVGYKTAFLGKYLNGYLPVKAGPAPGWDEWDVGGNAYKNFDYNLNQNRAIVHYGSDPQSYLTDVVSKLGRDFIRKSGNKPFLIEIATFSPHAPYIPAPRDANEFPRLVYPGTPAFAARPDASAPPWLKSIPELEPHQFNQMRRAFRMRAQSVLSVDKMIKDIRALLAELGEENNTYIVFSSDNGYHMGEYSLRPGKMTPFDTDIRVPLIVMGPGVPPGAVVKDIVENIDLNPTLVDLAGAVPPGVADGHSLVPLLRGAGGDDWRRMALIEHHGMPIVDPSDPDAPARHSANPPTYEAIRMAGAMYVEYALTEPCYYDLTRDPYELHNIAASIPAPQKDHLHQLLRANATCKGPGACWSAQRLQP
jgi:N-acetylglucosamine-6-sulfatase